MNESSSVTFRTAEPAAPVQSAPTTKTGSHSFQMQNKDTTDVPPSLYSHLEKMPYAMKHLGLELYSNDDDFADMQDKAKALDEFVLNTIKARGMEDSSKSYKEVTDALLKRLGKSPNEKADKTLARLSTAVGALKRLQAAKLPSVLNASSLKPNEFEELLA